MSQAAVTSPEQATSAGAERAPRLPRFAGAAVSRARLTLVAPARSEAPLAPFVVLLFVLLIGGVAGLLAFNTSMQQDAVAATELGTTATKLTARQQSLQIDIAALRDPQAIAARAKGLGMVPAPGAAFIELPSGKVLGDPEPAAAGGAMRINPLPAAKPQVLAPRPEVIKVRHHPPRGTDRAVRSVTDDRGTTTGSTTGTGTEQGGGQR